MRVGRRRSPAEHQPTKRRNRSQTGSASETWSLFGRGRRPGFAFRFGSGFGFVVSRRRRCRFLLGRLFITLAAVVGNIKSTAFKQKAGSTTDFAFDPAAAPFFLRTAVLGANVQRFGGNGLKRLKFASAFLALIFVCGHEWSIN